MNKAFDIGVESLSGGSGADAKIVSPPSHLSSTEIFENNGQTGTFFLETFGCQMNDHDSEKVAGLLLSRGYRQVETPEAARMILYNTCSIREKAAQKVFSRLGEYRERGGGQDYWRAGLRGAAGRRRDFQARAVGESGLRLGELSEAAGDAGGTGSGEQARHRAG